MITGVIIVINAETVQDISVNVEMAAESVPLYVSARRIVKIVLV